MSRPRGWLASRLTAVFPAACLGAWGLAACGAEQSADVHRGAPRAPAAAASVDAAGMVAPTAAAAPPARPADPPRVERAVYSLADNRLSAHVIRRDGLVVSAGSAGAAKYIRYLKANAPLEWGAARDGERVGRPRGKQLTLQIPLGEGRARRAGAVRLRAFAERETIISLAVNGRGLGGATAAPGVGTAEIAVPEGLLRAGENEVRLSVAAGELPDLAWVQVGGEPFGERLEPIHDRESGALRLPEGGGLVHYVWVPRGARLRGAVRGSGCAVDVRAEPSDGAPVTGRLSGDGGAVDLSALAERAVRLELIAAGCPTAELVDAALTAPGAEPEPGRAPPPRYLVIWVMDALRADRVRIFNPDARAEVPTFEELAGSATVFLNNYVQGNESRASYASMWTSTYPVVHGFLSSRGGIAPSWLTIDELMAKAGLYTSGVSANGYITLSRGFGTAWRQYINLIHEGGGLDSDWILRRGLDTVAKHRDRPWFLYLGTIDTHATWRAREPWLSRYDGAYRGRFLKSAPATDMAEVNAGKLAVGERDIRRIRALYDANVSYVDHTLRALLDTLTAWGIREQTMIVITADHGDELFERKAVVGHAKSLRETLVHVPLIIHYPPLFPANAVAEGTEGIDIVPTIAEAFGLDWNDQWQGESLVAMAHGVGIGYPRMIMASQFEHTHVGRLGRWKLRAVGAGGEQLFDVEADPNEREDLADRAPIERRMVADPLWLLRANNRAWKKRRWGNAANTRREFAEDLGE